MRELYDKIVGEISSLHHLPGLRDLVHWANALWDYFLHLGSDEQAFAIISGTIFLFTVVSILMGLRAVLIHLGRQRLDRRKSRLEATWTETLMDVLTGEREVSVLWRLVKSQDRLYFIDFLSAYARRVTGKELEIIEDAARPWLRAIRRRIKSRDPARRARALRTMADLTPQRSSKLLVDALDDPSDLVSMVAARTLIRFGESSHLPLILNRLNRYSIWSEQYTASMLASAGSSATFFLRVHMNQPRTSEQDRAIILRALAMIGDSLSIPLAEKELRTSKNLSTQIVALDMIGELGTSDQAPLVRQKVPLADENVLAHALLTLGQIGDDSDIPLVAEYLDHPSPWVALRAAIGLVNLGAEERLEAFIAAASPNAVFAQQALAEGVIG